MESARMRWLNLSHLMADKAGVAPSTVVRLCKNLGFSGFAQYKIGLISSKKGIPAIMPAVSRTDDTHTIFQKVFESSVRTLQDTLEMLDPAVTERVVLNASPAAISCFSLMQRPVPGLCATAPAPLRRHI